MPTAENKHNSFGRNRRLTDKASFTRVLGSRQRDSVGRVALQVAANEGTGARLGISVAKRHVKRSVDRNRVKRMMREAFRTHPIKRLNIDLFISIRVRLASSKRNHERSALRAEISALLEKAASRVIK